MINTKKYIVRFIFILLFCFVVAGTAFAQEATEANAKKYGVTFPVAELGNCADFSSCRTYCNDQSNREQCVAFAKKKGFYKEVQDGGKKEMIENAKSALGCTDESSCREVCSKEENFQKCREFSRKNNLGSGPPGSGAGSQKILQKAQEILGCNSEATCKAVCEQEGNKEKCSEFAKQTGLGGGIKKVGPGGCNSEESCRAYCEKNMDECKKFGGGPSGGQGQPPPEAQKRGPGGCNSEESCKAYCEKNPKECGINGQSSGDPNRRGPGGCNSEESCKAYCEKNPQECGGGQRPEKGNETQNFDSQRQPPEDFCKNNPEKCRRPPEGSTQNEAEYQRPPSEQNQNLQRPPQINEIRQESQPSIEQKPAETQRPVEQRPMDGQEVRGVSSTLPLLQKILNLLNIFR